MTPPRARRLARPTRPLRWDRARAAAQAAFCEAEMGLVPVLEMNMARPYTFMYEAQACSPKGYMHVSRARCTDESDAPRRSRRRGALSRALPRGSLPQVNLRMLN